MKVPLRIKIKQGANGLVYPDLNQVASELRKHMEWTKYVDLCGGWHYDKPSGHGEVDGYNPDPEIWFGVIVVDADFADAAEALYPELCDVLTEAEFEVYHDERAHAHEPEHKYNPDVMNGIRAKYGIAGALTHADPLITSVADREALDPSHPAPGVVRNRRRRYADFKLNRGITIDTAKVSTIKGRR